MEDKKCGGKTEIYLGQSREGRVRHQKTESKTIRTVQKRKKKRKKKEFVKDLFGQNSTYFHLFCHSLFLLFYFQYIKCFEYIALLNTNKSMN